MKIVPLTVSIFLGSSHESSPSSSSRRWTCTWRTAPGVRLIAGRRRRTLVDQVVRRSGRGVELRRRTGDVVQGAAARGRRSGKRSPCCSGCRADRRRSGRRSVSLRDRIADRARSRSAPGCSEMKAAGPWMTVLDRRKILSASQSAPTGRRCEAPAFLSRAFASRRESRRSAEAASREADLVLGFFAARGRGRRRPVLRLRADDHGSCDSQVQVPLGVHRRARRDRCWNRCRRSP